MLLKNIEGVKDMADCFFFGADIHKNNHTFVVLDGFQQEKGRFFVTDEKKELKELKEWIEETKGNKRAVIGLEDTGGHGRVISEFLFRAGYPVYKVSPGLVAQRRKRTAHRDKSDEKDALLVAKTLISEISGLPRVAISEKIDKSKELKELANDYDSLVKDQTRTKNKLHQLLYREYGPRYSEIFKSPFSLKALKYWKENKEGDCLSLDPEYSELTAELPRLEYIRKMRIRQKAEELLFIKEHLKVLAKLMEGLLFSHKNLLTLPGCGIIVCSRIVGEIQDIERFENSSDLAKYAGIAPRDASSGKTTRRKNSRSGNRQLNKAFYRLALSQITKGRNNAAAIEYYQRKIAEGKSKKRALKSLMRRNADIVYAMMKNGSDYDIQRHMEKT